MKPRFNPYLFSALLTFITVQAHADDRIKANNADPLNTANSWTNGIPGSADVAVWDATVTAANTSALGAPSTWQGIRIINPTGNVTIDGPDTLTLGSGGIDLSASLVNLTLNTPLSASAPQTWNIATSRTVTTTAALDAAGNSLTKSGGGTLFLQGVSSNLPAISITGGGFRALENVGLPTTASLNINAAVFETNGNFTRSLGTDPGQFRISGGTAGIGARDAALTLNLGGAGESLEWGSTHFNPSLFVLQNFSANAQLEIQNGINLGGTFRTIDVRQNTALVSGVVSGTAGFTLNGSNSGGTSNSVLRFTNTNTYGGRTVIANTSGGRTRLAFSTNENLGLIPAEPFVDNIVLVTGGVLQADESVILHPNRHLAIGSSGGNNTVTGSISAVAGKHMTIPGPIADRSRNAFTDTIAVPSTGTLQKIDSGPVLLLNKQSTYTGGTILNGGNLAIVKLSNGGVPSTIGASPSDAPNLNFNGGRLQYYGEGDSTDRLFTVSSGNTTLESSGAGPVDFTNTGSNAVTGNGSRNLNLTGTTLGNTLASSFPDGGSAVVTVTFTATPNQVTVPATTGIGTGQSITGPGIAPNSTVNAINGTTLTLSAATTGTVGATSEATFNSRLTLIKTGSGSWSLAGTNTHTGITRIRGGELIFDYSGNSNTSDPISTPLHVLESGTLAIEGKSSGITADTISTLQLGESHYSFARTELRKGTGDGVQLTVGTLQGSGGSTQRHDLIDLSSGPGNSVSVQSLGSAITVSNGVLMNNAAAPRASIVLRDTDGSYGFPTVTVPGLLQKIAPTPIAPAADIASTSSTVNNLLTAGDYATTAAAYQFSTLTFDTTSGPINLSLAGSLSAGGNGKGLLFSGPSSTIITGGANAAASALWFHNYLSGDAALNIDFGIGTTQTIMFGGTGFTTYSGIGFGNNFMTNGSLLRVTGEQDISNAVGTTFRVTSGAVFEIGADLNGAAAGDLSSTIGNGAGNFRFLGESGISAWTPQPGGLRVADFGAGQQLTWGTVAFLTNTQDTAYDGDYALKLSSAKSNATIELRNPISFNARNRVIEVAGGTNAPEATDAVLSGVLSGDGVGFTKTGPGVLALAGANTYNGETRVSDGILRVNGSSLAPASRLQLDPAGSLEITGTVHVSAFTVDGVPAPAGPVTHPRVTGNLVVGAPAGNTPYEQWVIDNELPADKDAPEEDADDDGLKNLIEYATGSDPMIPGGSVLAKLPGVAGAVAFNRAPGLTDITTVVEASPDLTLGSWTVIATSTAGAAFVSNDDDVIVTDTNNPAGLSPVTVTDNRAPAPTRLFHRLRVTD